jgi:hypothetical protein
VYAFRGGPTNCNAGFNAALIEPDEARGICKARLPVSHFRNALIVLNVSFAGSPLRFPVARVEWLDFGAA